MCLPLYHVAVCCVDVGGSVLCTMYYTEYVLAHLLVDPVTHVCSVRLPLCPLFHSASPANLQHYMCKVCSAVWIAHMLCSLNPLQRVHTYGVLLAWCVSSVCMWSGKWVLSWGRSDFPLLLHVRSHPTKGSSPFSVFLGVVDLLDTLAFIHTVRTYIAIILHNNIVVLYGDV